MSIISLYFLFSDGQPKKKKKKIKLEEGGFEEVDVKKEEEQSEGTVISFIYSERNI